MIQQLIIIGIGALIAGFGLGQASNHPKFAKETDLLKKQAVNKAGNMLKKASLDALLNEISTREVEKYPVLKRKR